MYAAADLDQGSFASHAVWREAFLFKLPDELTDEAAAPLYVPHLFFPPPTGQKERSTNRFVGCAVVPPSGLL